ncbi:helix-turn-helix transcriptional regulator [Campylobacter canadensis]|uniref:helix-turn-helix domain-containing protein n=1 Tax=Campylobacter canadensis TaxID=449520 RepID=UPI001CC9B0F5|nr:helix-turn-helix transcriptional regulator [Campylobacter canadensis]MBZ7996636.1 helix-turn-helix transcriptional regulator [Campylobacter canadensis]MBZ8000243.1 helix-turn-helix transcriptional regulator [Campylobacter canadensis]MBZ8002265.1 helix-turn-helix transcriptional regulator [Campylobacter canadensis]MBZ8003430.1 helix-turn-helix transcriptional regulator [Campylobacter canadensis]
MKNTEEIENYYKLVSSNVKKHRNKKNISQLELALSIGIKSIAFYSNCENNKNKKHFNLEHIYNISKVLGIDICELLKE